MPAASVKSAAASATPAPGAAGHGRPGATVRREHLEEAADWHLRLSADSPSCADRLGWQAWYDKAEEHRAAWQRVERLKALLSQAPSQATQTLARRPRLNRRGVLGGLGGLGAVAIGAVLYRFMPLGPGPSDEVALQWLDTAPGQRREVTLPDSGLLLLAPGSRVGLAYGPRARTITLAQGALRLQTAADPQQRPLQILTRDGRVTPLGTRFTLEQRDTGSLVAVQAHAVEVLPAGSKFPIRVEAGQRLRFFTGGNDPAGTASFADEAWTRGVLVAVDQPLERFVQDLQRLSGVAVACDPALAQMRVSGSFLASDPQRSLATLADQHGWRLDTRGQTLTLQRR